MSENKIPSSVEKETWKDSFLKPFLAWLGMIAIVAFIATMCYTIFA